MARGAEGAPALDMSKVGAGLRLPSCLACLPGLRCLLGSALRRWLARSKCHQPRPPFIPLGPYHAVLALALTPSFAFLALTPSLPAVL